MIDELFLIAHKVRGALAFDIAIQMPVGDEIFWILPSVGHRAYPYWHVSLNKISYQVDGEGIFDLWLHGPGPVPSDLQDFFEVTTKPIREAANRNAGQSLLVKLGLHTGTHAAVTGKLERRI